MLATPATTMARKSTTRGPAFARTSGRKDLAVRGRHPISASLEAEKCVAMVLDAVGGLRSHDPRARALVVLPAVVVFIPSSWLDRNSAFQIIEQRFRFLQIARVEPFGEPAVDAREVQQFGTSVAKHIGDLVSPLIGHSPVSCTAASRLRGQGVTVRVILALRDDRFRFPHVGHLCRDHRPDCVGYFRRRSTLRLWCDAGRCVSFANPDRALVIASNRSYDRQIRRPCRHLAKVADRLCRHFDLWVHLHLHFIWQATQRRLKRGDALGFVSHNGSFCN